jgi:TM2 domain-containing membrane protein YozV
VPSYASPPDPNAPGAPDPYSQPAAAASARTGVQTSPGLAFIFGLFIPGVGAIYNGQYLKGLVHAIIFGLLISLISSAEDTAGEPFLAMMLVGFIFYMAFEAYHTAKKRRMGIPVEEWSSLMGTSRYTSRVPIGPIILIAIGILFLLDTLHVIEFRQIGRFWPVILIVVGAFMLYSRISGARVPPAAEPYRDPGATRPTNGMMERPHER